MRVLALILAFSVVATAAMSAPAAAQYDCSDPQVRALLPTIRQAVAQSIAAYNQMPPSIRQQMDASMRQQTGYTFLQATQLLSDCSANQNAPAPVRPPAPNPPAPVPYANVPAAPVVPRVLSPEQYRIAIPRIPYAALDPRRLSSSHVTEPAVARAQGGPFAAVPLRPAEPPDGVPIGGMHFSLCWQLYHRTDCSDTQAASAYAANAQPIIDGLTKKKQAADDEVATLEHRLQLFQDAERKQDTTKLVASMRADNEEFMAVRNDLAHDAALSIATLAADAGVNHALGEDKTFRRLTAGDVATFAHDLPSTAALIGRHEATGERFDALDRESMAETLAGVATATTVHAAAFAGATGVAASAAAIGTGVAVGMTALRVAGFVALDYEVRKIDRAITEPQQARAQYEMDLEGRLAMARSRQEQIASELASQQQMLAEVGAYPKQ